MEHGVLRGKCLSMGGGVECMGGDGWLYVRSVYLLGERVKRVAAWDTEHTVFLGVECLSTEGRGGLVYSLDGVKLGDLYANG